MIADRIKEIREKNGLTQSAVACKLGVTRSTVNSWEMGINVPSAQFLVQLSKLFKVSTDYILDLDHREILDITFLTDEEKAAVYSLLNCFDRYRKYDSIKEEFHSLKTQGVRLPDSMQEMFEQIEE